MQGPVVVTFKGVNKTPELEEFVNHRIAKLEKICDYMISCRVTVEQPQKYVETGNKYRVRIDMTVPPGHELVATEPAGKGDMHDPLHTVIIKTFNAAERRLKKLTQLQRGEVKSHPQQQVMGIINQLFPEKGYGFIKTVDTNQDIYFHRNSLPHGDFDRLRVGTGVNFTKEQGEKGPQASSVEIVYKPGAGVEADR